MILHLNQRAFAHAKRLIEQGRAAFDERDEWSEHRPSSQQENQLIEERGWAEYDKWYLAIDESEDEGSKARYKFPFGDFEQVHRCALLSAESRAAQYHHFAVESAAADLRVLLERLQAALSGGHPPA